MQHSVDHELDRVRAMRTPLSLDLVERNVHAAIEDRSRHDAAGRAAGICAVIAAAMLGVAGGTLLAEPVAAAPATGPIGAAGALAPSTLLLGR